MHTSAPQFREQTNPDTESHQFLTSFLSLWSPDQFPFRLSSDVIYKLTNQRATLTGLGKVSVHGVTESDTTY